MNYITEKEISSQPHVWSEVLNLLEDKESELKAFLSKIKHGRRIVFTGAGSSDFVGKTVLPFLPKVNDYRFDTIATTTIITNVLDYLNPDEPLLLVSFGRSGNSPESMAAIELVDDVIKDVAHLIITCNSEGKLAKYAGSNKNYIINLPQSTNDAGFAMTGSFTGMALAAFVAFSEVKLKKIKDNMEVVINHIKNNNNTIVDFAKKIAMEHKNTQNPRVVYLSSGGFEGLIEEAALKLLELTAGNIGTHYATCMGFRHGPKSIINSSTDIIVFMSSNDYIRKYELDLIKELHRDNKCKTLLVLDAGNDAGLASVSHKYLSFNLNTELEFMNGFVYIYFAQMLGLYSSISYGINPDNPSPSGEVNRVVKGVTIHKFRS